MCAQKIVIPSEWHTFCATYLLGYCGVRVPTMTGNFSPFKLVSVHTIYFTSTHLLQFLQHNFQISKSLKLYDLVSLFVSDAVLFTLASFNSSGRRCFTSISLTT